MQHFTMFENLTRAQWAACVVGADLTSQAIRISSRYAATHAAQAGRAGFAQPPVDMLLKSQQQWLQELAALSHGAALRFYAELDSLATPHNDRANWPKNVRANRPLG